MPKTDPRTVAVNILTRVTTKGSYANLALDAQLKKSDLSERDAALTTNIVYGVIQHGITLDYYLKPFVRDRKLDPWVHVLLQTAVYQLVYLDRIPARAIFNESTKIAKKMGNLGIGQYVTAILRHLQRSEVPDLTKIEPVAKRLSITYSVPEWLTAKLICQLGAEKTESIFKTIDQPAGASLRVNTTKATPAAVAEALEPEFPSIRESALTPVGLVADGGHLAGTAEFADGLYTIQDESSMLVAPSLDVQPSSRVLDACAAPGGKTTHIAQYLDPAQGGEVVALDLHPHKVRLIEQNAKRLGLEDRVHATQMDAREAGAHFAAASFDRILVDAPCSGLGLLRRKPEIRYSKHPEDLVNLPKIQLALLSAVAPLLKVNGRLTYSTCTMVTEENQGVVESFLAAHPEYVQVPVKVDRPLDRAHNAPALQLFPDDYGTDGFFIASFVRK
ncbi:16S rRNA (cytosine(967)-C(5))-methyltransferase RsmB [Lacticaseibacillus camelliae]|uniref:16S rRNA (cytosine(967)-C(5))-methyltransferase n=1 Tax=Lacticaseibacillus camelliae DSM 22697 = JCM 13995 TaxID=1423730 RepID=A0A0R2FBB8_9LACO|nr:16S rRNA (cytosine(967)-C(5))-methyltransferase RsmB [Lacticaseibacillus camelliae]KRN24774.1 tRNA and rRNA cytosine-C5-methytransferase [Lacticaseibacillus camelliae DSM 22697 = JCM 13995]